MVDFTNTYASVAKIVTVCTLLSVASTQNWLVHQIDVHNAFFYGDPLEEVYMRVPLGFHKNSPRQVFHLKESLYGLRQAPHCWFFKFTKALHKCSFSQSYANYSLFTYHKGPVFLYVLIYVDNFVNYWQLFVFHY